MKKSALDDTDVSSEKFDGYVASYLKDVFAKRHGGHQSFERLISRISEDGSWTDEDSLLEFAYAVICCAARAFVAQPKRKHEAEEEGEIISRPDMSDIYSFLSLTTTNNLSGLDKVAVAEMQHNLRTSEYYACDPFSA
jgi:hypothetical protein